MEIDLWERVLTTPLHPHNQPYQPPPQHSQNVLIMCTIPLLMTCHPLPLPRPAILIDTSNSRRSWLCPVYPLDDVSVLKWCLYVLVYSSALQ